MQKGLDIEIARALLTEVGLNIVPFSAKQAEITARLWEKTHRHGLSLAERACLALALDRNLPALTADRAWTNPELGVEIRLVR